jgi:AcrR family transcriptional regulator
MTPSTGSARIVAMHQLSRNLRPGAGRPTREQAELRHQELLDRALELFLEHGYELATIDMIAAAVGMTKRTVYARYEDKSALFRATVQRAIERWTVPIETLQAAERESLEETLLEVARIRLNNAISPVGVRLQRIINTESYRFPEIFHLAYEQGSRPTINFLVDLLRRREAAGEIVVEDPGVAAAAFLSMMVGGPARLIWYGGGIDEVTLEQRMHITVRMFLNGVRRR